MKIYEHSEIMEQGKKEPMPQKKDKQKVVIVLLSLVCALLAVALAVFMGGFFSQHQKNLGKVPSYTTEELSAKVINQVARVKSGSMVGSGVVTLVNGEKYIATNYHVVKSGNITVSFYEMNEFVTASLVGFDAFHDIALIKCDNIPQNVGVAQIAESTAMAGEYVLAVGNNLGKGIAVFDGIMSLPNQMISPNGDKTVPVYQITAPINAGMSGGALYNNRGLLIGINTYQENATSGARPVCNVSYSVPISIAEPLFRQIVYENSQSAAVGQITIIDMSSPANTFEEIYFTDLGFRARYVKEGLKITAVIGGTPLEVLGGDMLVGDIITSIGDTIVTAKANFVPLYAEVLKYTHSETLETRELQLTTQRNSEKITLKYHYKRLKNY